MNTNQDPNSGKRLMLSLVLMVVIVLGVQFFVEKKPEKKPVKETTSKQENSKKADKNEEQKTDKKAVSSKKQDKDAKKDVSKEEIKKEQLIKKETENYILVFSSKQAILKKIILKKFLETGGEPIEISPKIKTGSSPLLYKLDSLATAVDFQVKELADGSILFTQENEKFKLEKRFIIKKDKYDITLEITLTNMSKERIKTKGVLVWGQGLGPFIEDETKRGTYDKKLYVSYYDVEKEKEVEIDDEVIKKEANIEWIGTDNRYFFVALIPDKKGRYDLTLRNESKVYDESIEIGDKIDIDPGKVYKKSFTVYMGTKDEKFLAPYGRSLEAITERGWFALITLIGKGIKWLLFQLYNLVGNFGIAIILLSLILKIVLHPLSKKSMDSMKKMQTLQPQIKALKEKYSDPKVLNAKTWELYRKNKINPMGGCLPLLLQMPFLFALYQVLPYVVELKNASFLWIKDFSSPDTVFYIDAFKDIAFLPYHFNVLPLIMVVLSFLQTKMQSGAGGGATSQGKMMTYMMPLVFLFIFWSFPSGLVLYWIIQTLFTVVHEYIITHRPSKKKDKKEDKNKKGPRTRKPLSRKS